MIKHNIIFNSASDWIFDLKKASGVHLWDSNGNKYIDFSSGWNVANLGWNNKEIIKAMSTQLKINTYSAMEFADSTQIELASLMAKSLPRGFNVFGRTTGGMESNEEAIKTAKAYTNRKKILGFYHSYHGQSIDMMSLVLESEEMQNIGGQYKDMERIMFPKRTRTIESDRAILQKFENKLDLILKRENVAAVLMEPGIITGWGSTYLAPRGFVKLVRKLTIKYGTLLIIDEVGTGFSRCGELFGMNIENVVPDIATFAKGFSNGSAAIGAMATTNEIADKTWMVTNLQSTFGWNPVACVAAKKNLEIHLRDRVWEKSRNNGNYIQSVLNKLLINSSIVEEVRGLGMEIGVSFKKSNREESGEIIAIKVVNECRKKGLFLLYGDDGNIQIMPPLIISRSELEEGLNIFVDVVNKINLR